MKNISKAIWQKANSSLLILSCLTMFFTTTQAQNSQSDRLKLEKKPETDEQKSSQRMILPLGNSSSNPASSITISSRLEAYSQRLNLVRSSSMEYSQQLKIQQVGEVFAQPLAKLENKLVPKVVETPIAKAERLLKQGEIAQAKQIYNKLIAENNKDYHARSAMAYILLQEGETELALKEYEEIIKFYDDTETQVNYGVALYRSGRISDAATQYQDALKNNKAKLPIVHFNLAMSYAHLGEGEKAIEHYQAAIKEKNGVYPEASNNLGLVYEAFGDKNKEATEQFKAAIGTKAANTPIAHYNLARQYYRDKEYEKAIIEFKEAIDKKSDFPEAYLSLGNLYLTYGELGQTLERAKEFLQNAIENYEIAIKQRNNIYPLAHENLAVALIKDNQRDVAFTHFRLAFEQYGEHSSQTFHNFLTSLKPSNQSSGFLIYNERSRPGNPGNITLNRKDPLIAQASVTVDNSKPDLTYEEQNRMIFESGLQKYEDIDESLKNLASIHHCGAQIYLIAGDANAAMEEIAIAAKLSEYKDPQIMKTFLSLLNLLAVK